MARIEDYALLGDTHAAALVGRDGSIDWLCLPRFDSPAAFAALLGDANNGRWRIAPSDANATSTRAYRDGSLVLDTTFTTAAGAVTVTDCMVLGGPHRRLIRMVTGLRGRVSMEVNYVVRFDYGSIVPWIRRTPNGLLAVAGPDALLLSSDCPLEARGLEHVATFEVGAAERVTFELSYAASFEDEPPARAPGDPIAETEAAWRAFSDACEYDGEYAEIVRRSLSTLKALTYGPTGGIVAAPTTSLPEKIGGVRNWDYRYCWLRDASLALFALLASGYTDAARDWQSWLLRAVAGEPESLQIVYGLRGTRRLPEMTLGWLAGYEGSTPVRIGNAAHEQFQLDVYGEVVALVYTSHRFGLEPSPDQWPVVRALVECVERAWREPDRGLWEVRGEPQHFTHSKVMAWVAIDRAIRSVEEFGYDGPVDRWRALRERMHAEICERGFDRARGTFTQYYGSRGLDASLLSIPMVGFLPPDDPRVTGTIAAIEATLLRDGFVLRYDDRSPDSSDDLPPGEGAFLACSFWLVDAYVLVGREADARALFERLIALCNDVGLLAEEYDPVAKRQLGNFPQAFSHVGLVNSAFNLSHKVRYAALRSDGSPR